MHLKDTGHKSEFTTKRADLYVAAMKEGADVRNNELLAFDLDKFKNNPKNIVEIGAGNGYLTAFLARKFSSSNIYIVDVSKSMIKNIKNTKRIIPLEDTTGDLAIANNFVDAIFSLATFHHIADKKYAFKEMNRILKSDGLLFIADVTDKTPAQLFFDTVVRKHCITGHNFDFLDADWISYLAKKSGFAVVKAEVKAVPWIFNNEKQMIGFIKKLTGLEISDKELMNSLVKTFKINKKNGKIYLSWQLGYYILKKKK